MYRLTALLLVLALPCVCRTTSPIGSPSRREPKQDPFGRGGIAAPGAEPLTPYGFAKAALVSLWYARNASDRAREIPASTAKRLMLLATITKTTKAVTNDLCSAKRSLEPFAAEKNDENMNSAANFMITVYDAQIGINERMLELLDGLEGARSPDAMEKISALQVERSQRWSDLLPVTSMVLTMLVDIERADVPAKAVITKAQKDELRDWIDEHFTEMKDGTPKEQWSEPAKVAGMFLSVLEGGTCAGE